MAALACARETLAGPMADDLVAYVSDQAHSSLARSARASASSRAKCGSCPDRRGISDATRPARSRRWRPTCAQGPPSALRLGDGGRNEHRRGRPAAGDLRDLPGSRRVVPRRRRLRRLLRADRGVASSCTASSWPTRSRSIRTSGSISRTSAAACSCARRVPPQRVRDHARTTCGRPLRSTREVNFSDLGMQLSRASRAFKVWLSLQYFGLGAFRARDRPQPRPRRARRAEHRGQRQARARGRAVARSRLLPAASSRTRDERRRCAHEAHLGARGERARAGVLHAPARPLRDPNVRAEPHHRAGGRRPGARVHGDRRRRGARTPGPPGLRAAHRRGPQLGREDASRAKAPRRCSSCSTALTPEEVEQVGGAAVSAGRCRPVRS